MTRLAKDPSPLIEKFYQAALEPNLWESALRGIRDYTPMAGLMFSCCDISALESQDPAVLIDLDPTAWDLYRNEYRGICPRTRYAMEHTPNNVFYDYLFTSETEIKRSEYYSLLRQHWGGTKYAMCAMMTVSDQLQCHLGIYRTANQGHPLKDDVAFLNALKPHISRALQLNYRLAFNNAEDYFEAHSLNGNTQGLIILDKKAHILFCNARAEEILGSRDGLQVEGQFISGSSSYDNSKLTRLINLALAPITRSHIHDTEAISVSRPSGKIPFRIVVSRLPENDKRSVLFEAAIAIFVTDPANIKYAPKIHLQQLFGVTPTEASLLAAFVRNTSLAETAEHLGITKNTARQHLKSIFYKTETSSQAELIKLVLSS